MVRAFGHYETIQNSFYSETAVVYGVEFQMKHVPSNIVTF